MLGEEMPAIPDRQDIPLQDLITLKTEAWLKATVIAVVGGGGTRLTGQFGGPQVSDVIFNWAIITCQSFYFEGVGHICFIALITLLPTCLP